MELPLDRLTGGGLISGRINGKSLRIITVLRVDDPITIFNSTVALILFRLRFVFNFQLICPPWIPQRPARALVPAPTPNPAALLFSLEE